MNRLSSSKRLWPAVVGETLRYWINQNRTLLLVIGSVALLSILGAVAGMTESSELLLGLLVVYAPAAAGLVTMSGIVSQDRASGLIVMWFQKSGTIYRVYGARYLIYLALAAGLAAGLGAIVAGVGSAAGSFAPEKAIRMPLVAFWYAVIPAAMVFAFSAWGVRRDAALTLFVIIISLAMGGAVAFDTRPWTRVLTAVVFPIDRIQVIGGSSPLGESLGHALFIIGVHFVAWTGCGLLGLFHTQRSMRRNGSAGAD